MRQQYLGTDKSMGKAGGAPVLRRSHHQEARSNEQAETIKIISGERQRLEHAAGWHPAKLGAATLAGTCLIPSHTCPGCGLRQGHKGWVSSESPPSSRAACRSSRNPAGLEVGCPSPQSSLLTALSICQVGVLTPVTSE